MSPIEPTNQELSSSRRPGCRPAGRTGSIRSPECSRALNVMSSRTISGLAGTTERRLANRITKRWPRENNERPRRPFVSACLCGRRGHPTVRVLEGARLLSLLSWLPSWLELCKTQAHRPLESQARLGPPLERAPANKRALDMI